MKPTLALAALLCALGAAPAVSQPSPGPSAAPVTGGLGNPLAYVRTMYASAGRSMPGFANSADEALSPRLRALFADEERYADGEVGRLEFNYVTGAQDDEITRLQVEESAVDGASDRKVVTARFHNMGKPTAIYYYFERIGGRWFLDDVSSPGYAGADGSGPWTLSLILRYGRF